MNELIYQKEPRKALSHCRPEGQRFGPSIDNQLTPCQVILSLSTGPVVLLQTKQVRRGFQNEVPSGPVWVDRSGIADGHRVKRASNFGPDQAVYAYPPPHYPHCPAPFPSLPNPFPPPPSPKSFTPTYLI